MIRIKDSRIVFGGGADVAVSQICHYFKCKQEDLELFLLQKLKEAVKRPKK